MFNNLLNERNIFFTDPPDPPDIKAVSRVLSLNITWVSSVQDNHITILDYRIKVMDGTTLQQVHEYIIITRTSLFIEHLKRNKTYIVTIQARNEVGYGAAATISATTLLAGTKNQFRSREMKYSTT